MILLEAHWFGKAVGCNERLKPGRHRWFKNPAYERFQQDLGIALLLARRATTPYMGKVKVLVRFKISARRDADSCVKPLLDCLELSTSTKKFGVGIIGNDRQVRELVVQKQDKPPGELDEIFLQVEELG